MIDPKTVLVATPTHDGSVVVECAAGLIQAGGLYASWAPLIGCSEIALARNLIVHQFLKSPYSALVWLDSDIGFSRQDFEYLLEGNEDCAVAEYSKKDGTGKPAQFGLGFARESRSAFERLIKTDMMDRFLWQNEYVTAFHPSGVMGQHQWSGEDHSFWKMIKMLDIPARVETRARLKHIGRGVYPYQVVSGELPEAQ